MPETDAASILFLHGWWATGWVWSRMAPAFEAAGFAAEAITLPDTVPGRSAGRLRFEDHLRVALDAADRLGTPVVIGHSVGGLMALKMAERAALPAVVALTPAAPRGVWPLRSADLLRLALSGAPAMLASRPHLPDRELLRRIDLNRLPRAEQDEVLARMRPSSGRQGLEIGGLGIPLDGKRIRCPALVVGAGDDRLTPPATTRATARRAGAAYREYPGHGHFILREPGCAAVAADVIGWLAETAGIRP